MNLLENCFRKPGSNRRLPLIGLEKTELVLVAPSPKRLLRSRPAGFYNPRKERRGSERLFSTDSLAPSIRIQPAYAIFQTARVTDDNWKTFPDWRCDEGDEKPAEGDFYGRDIKLKSPTTERNFRADERKPSTRIWKFERKEHQ